MRWLRHVLVTAPPMLLPLASALRLQSPHMSAGVGQVAAHASQAVPAALSVLERCDAIRSPPEDKREYRWIRASNGLRILLVHDAATEKAAAALEVFSGHFSDPPERPGLAHFTEHMMFLGTERYPEEGAFKAFLQKHGGSSNAFTGMEATGYHFSVQADALRDALGHFSSFFAEPLLREDSCAREMNAVDSEFRRNLQSDLRRIFQLVKATASDEHDFRKFSTGNLETLTAADVEGAPAPHEAVRSFYETHYRPDRMCLAVLGREDLDTLQAWVLDEFGTLPPPAATPAAAPAALPELPATLGAPLSAAQMGGRLCAQPVRESRSLRLMWTIPPERHFAASKATSVLSQLLSHEGEGGLSWLLTRKLQPPLATSVSGSTIYSLSDSSVYGVSVSLTPDGLARHDEVCAHIYGYLRLVANGAAAAEADGPADAACADAAAAAQGPASPLEGLHRENARMAALSFEYAEAAEPLALCKAAVSRMRTTPPEALLWQPFDWGERCDLAAVRELLGRLTPDAGALLLVGGGLVDPASPRAARERYYGTPHELTPVPRETLAAWAAATPHPALSLPPANPFLPDKLALVQPATEPSLVQRPRAPTPLLSPAEAAEAMEAAEPVEAAGGDDEGPAVWHLDSADFARPRATVLMLLRTPQVAGSARAAVLTTLLAELLEDALAAPLAPAADAGVGWAVAPHPGGLLVQASGYSQHVPTLSLELAARLRDFAPKPERFFIVREQLERSMRNRQQERPLWHAQYELASRLTTQGGLPSVHHTAALAFIEGGAATGCTVEAVAEHAAALRAHHFSEVFAYGNLLPDEAVELGRKWRATLGAAPLPPSEAPMPVGELLPAAEEGGEPVRLTTTLVNEDESNCGIEVHLQVSAAPSVADEARLLALAQLASKDAFHELRTVRQLGYVVQCGVRGIARARGLSVHIQSAVRTPPQLETEIEEWLVSFRDGALANLTDASLAEYTAAVAANLEEPPKRLSDETGSMWSEIVQRTHRWDHARRLAEEVRTLTVPQLLEFFDLRIADGAPQRRLIVSHAWSPKAAAGAAADGGDDSA